MIMVHIYALYDTISNQPFYIGATRLPLQQRLDSHIKWVDGWDTKKGEQGGKDRKKFMKEAIASGAEIKILALDCVPNNEANEREKYFYYKTKELGYSLLQSEHRLAYVSKPSKHDKKTKEKRKTPLGQ